MISKKSSRERKQRNSTPLFVFFLLYPYIVGFTPDSTSSYLETMFGIGTGQYVYHDCSGPHTQRFSDAGVSLTKKFDGPYRIGVNAGVWNTGERNDRGWDIIGRGNQMFLFPDLALDWEQFSFGTTGVRIGSKKNIYAEGRWLDQPPFYSGVGLLRAGIGVQFNDIGSRFWLGSNIIPYNNFGLSAQMEIPYSHRTFIFINTRAGTANNLSEYGISVGLRYISF